MPTNEPIFFGVCDQKPGEFYVATLFTPQTFIPLIPQSSWVIVEAYAPVVRGHHGYYAPTLDSVKIPLSMKSVLLAYTRCLLIALGGVSAVVVGVLIVRLALFREMAMGKGAVWGLLLIGSIAGYWATYQLAAPGPRKVQHLRDLIAANADDDAAEHLTLAQDEVRQEAKNGSPR